MSILLVAALHSESYAGTQSPNSTVNVSAPNGTGGGYGSYLPGFPKRKSPLNQSSVIPSTSNQNLEDVSVQAYADNPSCQGYAGAPPLGAPMPKSEIVKRATAEGIENATDSNVFGDIFENFARQSFWYEKNRNPIYSPAIGTTVTPDALANTYVFSPGLPTYTFPNTAIIESKGLQENSTIYTSDSQIVGLIDVAANSLAGQPVPPYPYPRPVPAVVFITPSQVNIGSNVVEYANSRNVAVWQHISCNYEVSGVSAGTQGANDLRAGYGVIYNSQVYASAGFTTIYSPVGKPSSYYETIKAPTEFNGDGWADILWRNTSSRSIYFWLTNGAGILKQSVPLGGLSSTPPEYPTWAIGATSDFNSDFKLDIAWRNSSAQLASIWLMNGVNFLSNVGLTPTVASTWQIEGGGNWDFNKDGPRDMVWRNTSTGEVAIWLMNGTSLSSSVRVKNQATGQTVYVSLNWKIVGVGDFNKDGQPQILWRNTSTGQVAIWNMNGTNLSSSTSLTTISDMNWDIGAVVDFNNDGHSDIIWRNYSTGDTAILQMYKNRAIQFLAGFPLVSEASWRVSGPR